MEGKCLFKKNFNKLTALFRALSEPNRLSIFSHICNCSATGTKESNVNEIKACCDVDLSVVSRHLSVLKEAGVLSASKKGKEVFYSLNAPGLPQLLRELADQIEKSQCCCPSEKKE